MIRTPLLERLTQPRRAFELSVRFLMTPCFTPKRRRSVIGIRNVQNSEPIADAASVSRSRQHFHMRTRGKRRPRAPQHSTASSITQRNTEILISRASYSPGITPTPGRVSRVLGHFARATAATSVKLCLRPAVHLPYTRPAAHRRTRVGQPTSIETYSTACLIDNFTLHVIDANRCRTHGHKPNTDARCINRDIGDDVVLLPLVRTDGPICHVGQK